MHWFNDYLLSFFRGSPPKGESIEANGLYKFTNVPLSPIDESDLEANQHHFFSDEAKSSTRPVSRTNSAKSNTHFFKSSPSNTIISTNNNQILKIQDLEEIENSKQTVCRILVPSFVVFPLFFFLRKGISVFCNPDKRNSVHLTPLHCTLLIIFCLFFIEESLDNVSRLHLLA